MNKRKIVTSIDHVPNEPHWAILEFDTIYIPDNGYGESESANITRYIIFYNEEELLDEIKRLRARTYPKQFKVLKVNPVQIQETVKLSIKE